jgi:hypothetical protein
MQQLYVQQQVVQPQQSLTVKQSHILAKSVADTQPLADEQRQVSVLPMQQFRTGIGMFHNHYGGCPVALQYSSGFHFHSY